MLDLSASNDMREMTCGVVRMCGKRTRFNGSGIAQIIYNNLFFFFFKKRRNKAKINIQQVHTTFTFLVSQILGF